jgi:phosphoglycolate phosphatase
LNKRQGDFLKLILFDIDGTLIRTAGAGKKSMEKAFEKIYNIKDGFHGIHMMGRTDPSIITEALSNHHLEWRHDEVEQFREAYFRILEREIKISRPGKRICPGVASLLELLDAQPDIILGLLTGNWRYSAFIKLRFFKIDHYFTIGAFGDDSSNREDLIPVVIDRLNANRGIQVEKQNMYVVGDTPTDIRCAKPQGVRTVAVATGFHTVEDLALEKPDYLFENFQNTNRVFHAFSRLEGTLISP